MPRSVFSRLGLGGLWLAALAAGLWLIGHYETAAGRAANAPADWPSGATLPPPAGRPTVVLFAHPHCPCTKATLTELAGVLSRAPADVQAYVVFALPAGAGDDWQRTPLWQAAARLPRTRLWPDPDGRDADRFGAATSGQVLLYDAAGRRLWQGGLTASRGRTGPSPGRAALLALLTDPSAAGPEAPVYGCLLTTPQATCDESGAPCPN
jgi:hypothetical protein